MYEILGLIMIYTWIHSVIIGVKKIQDPTPYESCVMIGAIIFMALYVIGTI